MNLKRVSSTIRKTLIDLSRNKTLWNAFDDKNSINVKRVNFIAFPCCFVLFDKRFFFIILFFLYFNLVKQHFQSFSGESFFPYYYKFFNFFSNLHFRIDLFAHLMSLQKNRWKRKMGGTSLKLAEICDLRNLGKFNLKSCSRSLAFVISCLELFS